MTMHSGAGPDDVLDHRVQPLAAGGRPRDAIGGWLIALILGATLAQNFYDISLVMQGGGLNLLTYEGPFVLKLLKDVLYIGLLCWAALLGVLQGRGPRSVPALALIVVVLASFAMAVLVNGLEIALIGVRWVTPFLIFLFAGSIATRLDPMAGARWLLAGMVVCFAAQLFQLFNMPPIYGELAFGLAARTPGIFIAPNSTAFFACACCACIVAFRNGSTAWRVGSAAFALVICLLAQSGTGIITAALLLLWTVFRGVNVGFVIVSLVAGVSIFLHLNEITMREDYVSESGGNRVDVFVRMLVVSVRLFGDFGLYTNAAMLRQSGAVPDFVLDSLWASLLGNFGVLSALFLMLTVVFCATEMKCVVWPRAIPALLTFFLFSMTTIVFEAFPMNLLLIIALWSAQARPTPGPTAQAAHLPR